MNSNLDPTIVDVSKMINNKCSNCGFIIYYQRNSNKYFKPKVCPHCEDKYWDKPNDERELFFLQEKYHETRDQKYLGQMGVCLKNYSMNMIKGIMKNKKIISKLELEEKANDSANEIILRFLKEEDCMVYQSFGGWIKRILRGYLWGKQDEDKEFSLNHFIGDEKNKELQDVLTEKSIEYHSNSRIFNQNPEQEFFKQELSIFNEVENIIYIASRTIQKNFSTQDSIKFLIGLEHKFTKKHSKMKKYLEDVGYSVKRNIDNCELTIRKTIKEANYV
jgi:hypothetical protein